MPRNPRRYDLERAAMSPQDHADNAKRTKLRRAAIKAGKVTRGDGKDLDHRQPLSKGGANTLKNTRVTSPSANRSFKRNKDGSMK